MMKTKLTVTHDRLALKAKYPDGSISYSQGRNGYRISIGSTSPNLKVQLGGVLSRFNQHVTDKELVGERFERLRRFLDAHNTVATVVESALKIPLTGLEIGL